MANETVISGNLTGNIYEDGTLTASGQLKVDGQSSGFQAFQQSSGYGTFALLSDGNWTYTLNNSAALVQGLGGSQTALDRFFISWYEGTTQAQANAFVELTIQGQNDTPIVAGDTVASLLASSQTSVSGTLTIADADSSEKSFVARAGVPGQYGSFTIDSAGAWSYALRSATTAPVQATDDVFAVQTADGTATSVKISVSGGSGTAPSATTGRDTFGSSSSNDSFSGLAGTDTVVFRGDLTNYTITPDGSNYRVTDASGLDGIDTLSGIERLQFANKGVALDLGINDAAGRTALLIGAVLPGVLALDASKQALLGAVISLFDSGYSMRDLSGALLRLPIWSTLTGKAAPTNSDIASYLISNVHGHPAEQASLDAAVTALNTESFQGDWLASLAVSAEAQTHIGLVGLAQTGLVFA